MTHDATHEIRHDSERQDRGTRPRTTRIALPGAFVIFLLVVLWGGYSQHWAWTGINGRTATLWDWLHLLLLPVAVAIIPIWFSQRDRLTRRHKLIGLTAIGTFSVLVLAGYEVPRHWTGFSGNKLWDWLELLALPVAVAMIPVVGELRRGWTRTHALVVGVVLLVFTAIVIGAYVGNWSWTGFHGNTFWNWLQLLLLPLLLPTVIVPTLMPMAVAGLSDAKESGR